MAGTIVYVFCYLWFHLQSVILAATSIFMILVSYPLTLILYNVVFRITFYHTLQNMVLFIIMGIAADDVFVFYDAWR